MSEQEKRMDEWRDVPKQVQSEEGQTYLFGESAKPKADIGKKEWQDRRSGQTFLFDREGEQ